MAISRTQLTAQNKPCIETQMCIYCPCCLELRADIDCAVLLLPRQLAEGGLASGRAGKPYGGYDFVGGRVWAGQLNVGWQVRSIPNASAHLTLP